MPVLLPSNVALVPASIPVWGVTVQNAINSGIVPAWNLGQSSRTINLPASLFNIAVFPSWASVLLDQALGEYRAAGWQVATTVASVGASGLPTAFNITLDRW